MATVNTADNRYGVANYIVAPTIAQGANFTTLAAVNAVVAAGDTVFIKPGTYTEDPSPVAGVNYVAFEVDAITPNVIVKGNWTFTSAGKIGLSGICLETNGAAFLTVSGSAASVVNLYNCNLDCVDTTGIAFTSSSSSAQINIQDCIGDIGTTGISLFHQSCPGGLSIFSALITNSGLSSTPSTCSAGFTNIFFSSLNILVTNSSTNALVVEHSSVEVSNVNAIALTIGASASIFFSFLSSGTASAISISGGATVFDCIVSSSNTNAITGAGSITYGNVVFGSSTKINTTTQTGGLLQGGVTQAPSAGYIGEEIRATLAQASAHTLSTGTTNNVASISLTAGIWSISGIVSFAGTVTGTNFTMGISAISAGQGTAGDSATATPYAPTANQDNSLTIPALRSTLTTTTTIYLTATALFTVGTCKAYGRISAVRVG